MSNRIRWIILSASDVPGPDVPCIVQENVLDLPDGVDVPGTTRALSCADLNLNPAWTRADVVAALQAIAPAYVSVIEWPADPAPVVVPEPEPSTTE